MAGFRLAPKAAQARRSPWQRRRLTTTTSLFNRTVTDGWAIADSLGHVVAYQRTASDGWTWTDAAVGANPSAGTATGGLIFLFSQGTAGSAYTRSATDGWAWADSVSRSLTPVTTVSYSRSVTDGWVVSDAASGSFVAAGATTGLTGIELLFTAVLDVELSFVGE